MILVVDDDTLVLENTAAMLEEPGHRAIEARSGQQALDLLSQRSVDLVLTDQAMPGMTGVQLAGAIRSRWANMPIILAIGFTELPADLDCPIVKLRKAFEQVLLAQTIVESLRAAVVPFRSRQG